MASVHRLFLYKRAVFLSLTVGRKMIFLCLNQRLIDLRFCFVMQALPLGTVAFDGGVIAKTGHGMTPFFVFDSLPLGVFFTADFALLTPKANVRK